MADKPAEKKRPWFAITRIQGLALTVAGIAMLFHPLTNPYAGSVISGGLGWMLGGVNANESRKAALK